MRPSHSSVVPTRKGTLRSPKPRWANALLSLALSGLAVLPLASPPAVVAQSIIRGEIEGVVRGVDGLPVPEVAVTASGTGSQVPIFGDGQRDGSFLVSMLEAGDYDILVEARGYIPRLVQGIQLRPGRRVRVNVTLVPTALPPQRIDTVAATVAAHPRFDGESGRWIRGVELLAFPDPRASLARSVALAPMMDASLGGEGLPGVHTTVLLDGLPFTPAVHPMQRGGADLPLFPRSGLSSINVHRRADVEWSGAAGSYVAAGSRSASGDLTGGISGAGSAGALRSSEPLSGAASTGGTGFWGGANVHIPLDDSGTRVFIAVEGVGDETPHLSPFSQELAERLIQNAPSTPGTDLSSLGDPWTSSLQAVSGLARLDWRLAGAADVAVRGTFATIRESGSRLFAGEPDGFRTAPFDGTDLALGASILAQAHRLVTLEVRGGVHHSTREWSGPAGGSERSPLAPTRFLESGVLLGSSPGLSGAVSRTEFSGNAVGHYRQGPHWVKGGVSFSLASHTFQHVYGAAGEFLFSNPEALAAGNGIVRQVAGPVPSRSFTVPEFGFFGQYRWEPMRGVHLSAGLRYDREVLPRSALLLPTGQPGFPGTATTLSSASMTKLSPRLGVSWDLTGEGGTVVDASMAVQFDGFDPAALAEAATLSGSVSERRVAGGVGSTWPDLPAGSTFEAGFRPTLTILGPRLQPPRTARANVGVSQRLTEGTVLHLSGTFRRTEFLLRRSDLNLTLAPSGTLQDGRPVLGNLQQFGAVVTPLPGSSRRFQSVGQIWALTADGASEHIAVSAAFEHQATQFLDLFANYTFSATEDNLVGAASGIPDAMLVPSLPANSTTGPWDESTSDFDVPHRLAGGARMRIESLEGIELSGVYRFESGRPFTAGYRAGVDANGDGSGYNDPALVPAVVSGPADRIGCLQEDEGRIARRNGCRGPGIHFLDLRASVGLFRVGGSVGALTLELFNVLDAELGHPDSALLLVDPSGTLTHNSQTGVYTLPVVGNPHFGAVTQPYRPGRLLRIGFTLGMPWGMP